MITTAHGLAAANAIYWPEIYVNQPIVKMQERTPYMDTAPPRTFGSISPFDPELFYGIDEYADDLLKDERRGKYSPLEVADWLQDLAETAEQRLEEANRQVGDPQAPAFRRWAIDVAVQAGIGVFFADKFRSGLAFSLFERTQNPELLRQALSRYESARDAWAKVAEITKGVYREDLTFGYFPYLRGHWAGRLQDIEHDVSAMAALYEGIRGNPSAGSQAPAFVLAADKSKGSCPAFLHAAPEAFNRGQAVELALELEEAMTDLQVQLHYRKANQGESYNIVDMTRKGTRFAAEIPASYTDSDYPLVYFFELVDRLGRNAWIVARLRGQFGEPALLCSEAAVDVSSKKKTADERIFRFRPSSPVSYRDDDPVRFHLDGVRLQPRDIIRQILHHLYLVRLDSALSGVEHRLAGDDVEFPAMPRAPDNFSVLAVIVFMRLRRQHDAHDFAGAQLGELVRTYVFHRVVVVFDIENADGLALELYDHALSRPQLL